MYETRRNFHGNPFAVYCIFTKVPGCDCVAVFLFSPFIKSSHSALLFACSDFLPPPPMIYFKTDYLFSNC